MITCKEGADFYFCACGGESGQQIGRGRFTILYVFAKTVKDISGTYVIGTLHPIGLATATTEGE